MSESAGADKIEIELTELERIGRMSPEEVKAELRALPADVRARACRLANVRHARRLAIARAGGKGE